MNQALQRPDTASGHDVEARAVAAALCTAGVEHKKNSYRIAFVLALRKIADFFTFLRFCHFEKRKNGKSAYRADIHGILYDFLRFWHFVT